MKCPHSTQSDVRWLVAITAQGLTLFVLLMLWLIAVLLLAPQGA